MTQSIPVPTHLLRDEDLVALRETCLSVMQGGEGEECPSTLTCIAAVNAELDARAIAVYHTYHPTPAPTTRRPNLYIVR